MMSPDTVEHSLEGTGSGTKVCTAHTTVYSGVCTVLPRRMVELQWLLESGMLEFDHSSEPSYHKSEDARGLPLPNGLGSGLT